jgi:hypothetical protein
MTQETTIKTFWSAKLWCKLLLYINLFESVFDRNKNTLFSVFIKHKHKKIMIPIYDWGVA